MNSQQLYDCIIKPTHLYMGGNYESRNANFLSLCTAAIESNCGYYIKQVGGPALGIWQMEPATESDILINCDAIQRPDELGMLQSFGNEVSNVMWLTVCPMYACAMARLKYSMDVAPLPDSENIRAVYDYYKRIYNTPAGASTYEKFKQALINNGVFNVKL
ncbi:MAG: hypothetical protein MJK15_05060 [Colwellia sp.]|nr:hypothetical protein [Colwellia sp.]